MSPALVPLPGPGPGVAERPAPAVSGAPCRNHARVPSALTCAACLAPICLVCRFTWPGERHFCPACATAPRAWVVQARRRRTAWSLGLAAWGSLGLLVLVALGVAGWPVDATTQTSLGFALIFLCIIPGAAGLALGLTVRSLAVPAGRTFLTPPIVWNGVLLLLWLVVMIVGAVQAP